MRAISTSLLVALSAYCLMTSQKLLAAEDMSWAFVRPPENYQIVQTRSHDSGFRKEMLYIDADNAVLKVTYRNPDTGAEINGRYWLIDGVFGQTESESHVEEVYDLGQKLAFEYPFALLARPEGLGSEILQELQQNAEQNAEVLQALKEVEQNMAEGLSEQLSEMYQEQSPLACGDKQCRVFRIDFSDANRPGYRDLVVDPQSGYVQQMIDVVLEWTNDEGQVLPAESMTATYQYNVNASISDF